MAYHPRPMRYTTMTPQIKKHNKQGYSIYITGEIYLHHVGVQFTSRGKFVCITREFLMPYISQTIGGISSLS